jgi:hypothetical protein
MNPTQKQFSILAITLSSRGFGYAVMEDENRLISYGNKAFKNDRNARSLIQIEKIIARTNLDLLVLQDVNAKGTHRAPRIKQLHRKVMALAKKHKIKVAKISRKELRVALLDREDGTKHEMAELMAKQFPDELAAYLPPKRKPWTSEDARMDIFDAVGLVVAWRMQEQGLKRLKIKTNNSEK